jgi:hypothetical protein
MTRRGLCGLAVCAVCIVATTACGNATGGDRATRTVARPDLPMSSSVTSPAAVTDRGRDYAGIARSLLLYGRRLEVRCPDATLVDRAYAWGSELERSMVAVCHAMHREHRYIVEVDRAPLHLTVVSVRGNAVSFRLVEQLDHRELVDRRGRVLERVGPATETYAVSIMRFTARDPWRLDDVHRVGPRFEVRL